jgi:DNA modification methylase
LPLVYLPEKLDLSHTDGSEGFVTSDFHPYFASFAPKIPNFFLNRFTSEGDTVLDPFCGSGTTLVEAKINDRNSIGIDVNPLACLISKVKTTTIPDGELNNCSNILTKIRSSLNSLYGQLTLCSSSEQISLEIEIPEFHNRDYWFKPHVLRELGTIKSCISAIKDVDLRDFCLVAFSGIIVRVSNQEHETRYKRVDKKVKPFDSYLFFEKKINEMISYMKEFNRLASSSDCKIYNDDLRFSKSPTSDTADLIVTSPPYLNAWDYNLYQRFRFYWLGFDPNRLRNSEIGAHLKHSYMENSVQNYVADLKLCLQQMYRMLKTNAYCCIIIGEAFVRGKRIDVGELILETATDMGFEHQRTYTREVFGPHYSQRRSANNKVESVIILHKA